MSAHAIEAAAPAPQKVRVPLNGINTPALFATIDVVKGQGIAKFALNIQKEAAPAATGGTP